MYLQTEDAGTLAFMLKCFSTQYQATTSHSVPSGRGGAAAAAAEEGSEPAMCSAGATSSAAGSRCEGGSEGGSEGYLAAFCMVAAAELQPGGAESAEAASPAAALSTVAAMLLPFNPCGTPTEREVYCEAVGQADSVQRVLLRRCAPA